MFFKNFKSKLFMILLIITSIIMPFSVYAYTDEVILGGENIGIEVNSSGVLVVGFYDVDGISPGRKAGLNIGDVIIKVDDTVIDGITDLSNYFDNESLKITYKRGNKVDSTTLDLKLEDNVYKTGLYVKDSIVGIGTLTFIEPNSKRYGALGHEILEQTTGVKFEVSKGKIFESDVTGIEKAERGSIGEKNAIYNAQNIFGTIDKNDETGIYGDYTAGYDDSDTIKVSDDVRLGDAFLVTVIKGDEKKKFSIDILRVDKNDKVQNILFEVTDKYLLEKGNGIVQGMSGSPIIQDDKLIGAVSHVIVDDPHKGYGILITNMLEESIEEE